MIGVRGARVVVVDDDEGEALPIIKAFARHGVPTVFFDGHLRGLPRKVERLRGVRLAVLDMDVVGGGVPDTTKIAALSKLVASILSPDNGPYIVLAWTKHPELRTQFEDYLFRIDGFPRPILALTLEKAACKTSRGRFDVGCIVKRIGEALEDVSPFMVLQAWEERAFDAVTDVTNALSEVTSADAGNYDTWRADWRKQALRLMHALAFAVAEQHLNVDSCLTAFYGALNPLHADRMESNTVELAAEFTSNVKDILAETGDCGTERRAKVNSMLHLAFDSLQSFSAGNLYRFAPGHKPGWVPSPSELLDDLIEPLRQEERTAERKAEVLAAAAPLLIEVSPLCDHAQKNVRLPRFVAGVIVRDALMNKMKRGGGFVWQFGPVYLSHPFGEPGQYTIVLSARHLVTQTQRRTEMLRPSARLRAEALADLHAWLFHHAARPGLTLLRR